MRALSEYYDKADVGNAGFCFARRYEGRRPHRDGEGETSFASERSGTAGGTI